MTVYSFIRKMYYYPMTFKSFLSKLKQLKYANFTTKFIHEGDLELCLPNSKYIDLISESGRRKITNSYSFLGRPKCESLLRKIVYHLYQFGVISKDKSIIDIGCWLSDNAAVWAKNLTGADAKVFAIDPSKGNILFGTDICKLNGIENITYINAVCSHGKGIEVSYSGDIDHASFDNKKEKDSNVMITETVESVIPVPYHKNIGLFHIDVEGFENSVLMGAKSIIEQSMPVIIFEQHISSEDALSIIDFLYKFGYSLYMINEVFPHTKVDCRNFIALPNPIDRSTLCAVRHSEGAADGIWYAALDDALIPVRNFVRQ